jgi:hypothetical protein
MPLNENLRQDRNPKRFGMVMGISGCAMKLRKRPKERKKNQLNKRCPSNMNYSLHFDGFSTQACAEVARHTWTHLDLGRPCQGLLKVCTSRSLGFLDSTMLLKYTQLVSDHNRSQVDVGRT